jgi:YHS domain-containing protein
MFKQTLIAAVLAGLISTASYAGDQYVDKTGFAVSGYDVVAYFDLKQSKVGQSQTAAIPGRADLTADYNGAKFAFSTQANLDKFKANPDAYAPQFDGHCAYGVAQGGKVPGNPNLWRIVDGKLYLNITKNVVGFWEEDIPGNISVAGKNWTSGLEPKAASNDRIPKFTSAAPIAN